MEFILNESGLAGMIWALQNRSSRAGGGCLCACVCVCTDCDIITQVSLKIVPRILHNAR